MADRYLTTSEVADYLRLKERKVYDLVASAGIPHARITGKLLFPQSLIDLWVDRHVVGPDGPLRAPPPIVAGSSDPLLEWALTEAGTGLARLPGGSEDGMTRIAEGAAVLAGLHLLDVASGDYNVPAVRRRLGLGDVVLVHWARRRQGLVVSRGNPFGVSGIADLCRPPLRIILRKEGAGSGLLLDHLLAAEGIARSDLCAAPDHAATEEEVGAAIIEGRADVGLAIEAVARRTGLDFLPLRQECYDLLLRRRDYFEAPLQRLFAFVRTEGFAARARTLGGYDVAEAGAIRYNA